MNSINYKAFSTPHSHPSWNQIFTSESCFQILLACVPPLILNDSKYTEIKVKHKSFYRKMNNVLNYIEDQIMLKVKNGLRTNSIL